MSREARVLPMHGHAWAPKSVILDGFIQPRSVARENGLFSMPGAGLPNYVFWKDNMMRRRRLCSIMHAGLTRVACLHESGHDTVHGGVCVRCNQYPCSAEHMATWDVLQLRSSTHIIMEQKTAGST